MTWRTGYAVYDLEQPELFDRRMRFDDDPENIRKNRDNARDWQGICRRMRIGYYINEGSCYLGALANNVMNPMGLSDEKNMVFSAAFALTGLGIRLLSAGGKARRVEQEYQRRVDALDIYLEEKTK